MHPTVFKDVDSNVCKSGVDYYFLQADGQRFKVLLLALCHPFVAAHVLVDDTGVLAVPAPQETHGSLVVVTVCGIEPALMR